MIRSVPTRHLWPALLLTMICLGGVAAVGSEVTVFEVPDGEPPTSVEPGTWGYEVETRAPEATVHYVRIAATTFVQHDSTNTWSYGGAGCIYKTGGSDFFDVQVQVPDGVELDYLRVYFNDTDASHDARAILFAFDGAGGNLSIASAQSTGTPGFGSEGSGFFSHIVDNTAEALVVRINFLGATTSAVEICGVRLRYTAP